MRERSEERGPGAGTGTIWGREKLKKGLGAGPTRSGLRSFQESTHRSRPPRAQESGRGGNDGGHHRWLPPGSAWRNRSDGLQISLSVTGSQTLGLVDVQHAVQPEVGDARLAALEAHHGDVVEVAGRRVVDAAAGRAQAHIVAA